MLKVEVLDWKQLSEEEKEDYPKEYCEFDCFLKVTYNYKVILLKSDNMEPEDVRFYRGLSWVPKALKDAYNLGYDDACVG